MLTYRPADDKIVSTEQGIVADPNNPVLSVQSRSDVAYDAWRNPVAEAVSSGGIVYTLVHRSFQAVGRLECEARRMHKDAFPPLSLGACNLGTPGTEGPDRITRNVYDAAGQLLIVQRAVGTSVQQDYARYEYTLNGKQKAVIDANGNRAEMTYDGFDRQRRWIFPSNTPGFANQADYEEYGYDPVGNRTSLRKRSGAVIGYQYDALNRMILKDVPEAGGDVAYSYDVRGLQLSALYSATGLGIASAYDGFGRQVSSTTNLDGTSRTYAFHYDAAGNRTRVIHPDGPWFGYDYDALGRMTALKEWTGTTLVALGYHPSGLRSVAAYANGVVTSYAYDPIGRLTGLTLDLAAPGQDVTFTYAHNPASQIVSRNIDNDSYVFAKAASSTGYAVNGLNQYTQVAGAQVVHDPNGNLTEEGGRTLAYDSENRLVSAGTTGGGTPFGLGYDPQGRWRGFVLGGATHVGIDMVGTDIVTLRFGSDPPVERYAFAPGWTSRWSATTMPAPAIISTPTATATWSRGATAPPWPSGRSAMTNMAGRAPGARASSTPARCTSARSTPITTTPAGTTTSSGGSCRPIRWGMTAASISTRMSATIRSILPIRAAKGTIAPIRLANAACGN